MKTLFKVLALSILLTASSVLTFAQEQPSLEVLYAQFRKEAPSSKTKCGGRGAALVTGKKIIELYSTDEINAPVIKFVKDRMAEIEKEDPACERSAAYNQAFEAKNWANFFTTGKAIIAAEGPTSPLALDVMLDLASVGFNRAVEKDDTYNADTLTFAKTGLERVNAGTPSFTKKYGAWLPFETKEAAQSWLNYIIGWQMYNKMNQQKEALPYFYKSAQIGTAKKNDTTIYTNIGQYYFNEAVELDKTYREKRAANNNVDNDETKALLALARGTADRASDAFGRAYNIVKNDASKATLKTNIAKTLTDLYKFRFNLADAKQTDIDKYVSELVAKPMPDPAIAVTPVVEATPTTTTTSTTPTTTLNSSNAAATTSATTTTTTSAKTTPATKSATTTKTTTTVKKPVKKKGTR